MQKNVNFVVVVACFFPWCASASITTTIQGSCTTTSPTGVVLDSQTYPNTCLGIPAFSVTLPGSGVSYMALSMDSALRVSNGNTDTGNHYFASFSATAKLDEWLVVTGGTGAGVIRGWGYEYLYLCCSLAGPTASASLQEFGGGTFNGSGSSLGGDFSIPFLFGVPFHIVETQTISYTGKLTNLSVPGNFGFSDAEANFQMRISGIYDTQNNLIPNAQVTVAPEPATWLLLACGITAVYGARRITGTAPRSTR